VLASYNLVQYQMHFMLLVVFAKVSKYPKSLNLTNIVFSCERGFSTQNLIKSSGRCALNITTLDALMRIVMTKIPMESLDFENIWERWMSVKERRFQE
jgi:hypothetical protein